MYSDVTQRNFGKARMEAYLDEAQTRRLVAAYEARETERSLPKIDEFFSSISWQGSPPGCAAWGGTDLKSFRG